MKKFIVISHTHWDREWYMPFAVFRLRLADLVDRLFEILAKDPDYIFHLDMQTVVLEDYLEIRPQNETLLKKYVAAGNIRVGPWYLQNDFYLTDGEATVRNLMIGSEIAERFGRCGKVGYAPDQFGNVSQLPQILNGFGIDFFIFGRGFRQYETADGERKEKRVPAEFEWRGEDGSRCIAVYLRNWYNNAQHIPQEEDLARLLLDINEKNFEGFNVSPYILLMNGVDHLEAQEDVREIIARLRGEGRDIEQTGLDEYAEKLSLALRGKKLYVHTGALNKGGDYEILKGCWSSRIYLKQANVRSEDLLENKLEPLYTCLEASGFGGCYPRGEMRYLWKMLLREQPHDNICGCSRDSVHRHMEDSFERIGETGEELLSRGLALLASHIRHPLADERNYSVVLFNPTERAAGGVVEAELNFPRAEKVDAFSVADEEGRRVPYEIVSREKGVLDVFSPLNLPGVLDVERVCIRFYAREVAPFSAAAYAVVPGEKGETLSGSSDGEARAENEYYLLAAENGVLVLTDKRTGRRYTDPVRLEDCADRGDSYVYRKGSEAEFVSPSAVIVGEAGVLKQSVVCRFAYERSAFYDFETGRPSEEKALMEAESELILTKGSETLEVRYRLVNRARDHRVRLALKSGIAEEKGIVTTDSPFDCAARTPHESCDVTDSDTHHNSTFAVLSDGKDALTVYTEGQHEMAKIGGGLAFTILRATGVISRAADTFRPTGGKCWTVPENQCLREISGRFGVVYGAPVSGAANWAKAKLFRNGLLCRADSFDRKKYSGGRFAVQSSKLEKLYYLKDKYEGKKMKDCFFSCDGEEIAVTCCKAAEKGGAIVRFVNLSSLPAHARLRFRGKAYRASLSEREETLMGERETELTFAPKQIVTVRFSDVGD